jgi:hypothetical protein
MLTYFLNLFLPNAARPTKPEPSSISVASSGTAEVLSPVEGPSEEVTGVEEKLDLLTVVAGSSKGQLTIPKNIITAHKNINNFIIFFSLYYKNENIIIHKYTILLCQSELYIIII